jgi:hypothetical protein
LERGVARGYNVFKKSKCASAASIPRRNDGREVFASQRDRFLKAPGGIQEIVLRLPEDCRELRPAFSVEESIP